MSKNIEMVSTILAAICIGVAGFISGTGYIESKLHKAADDNKTLREFYSSEFPISYKAHYSDWKVCNK